MSSCTIGSSTELVRNYQRAEVVQPGRALQALQTEDGRALLFSVGTDPADARRTAFFVTAQVPGDPANPRGWVSLDLSGGVVGKLGSPNPVSCEKFSVAQPADGRIHMAMVVRETIPGEAPTFRDRLYLSLGNRGDDTSWTRSPEWAQCHYDDPDRARNGLTIAGVLVSEAADGEYVVVDVVDDPGSASKLLYRYFIDVRAHKANGRAWHAHPLPADVEAVDYASVLGRRDGSVDGVYTSGRLDNKPVLMYRPLWDPFRPADPPEPVFLHLTPDHGVGADAIATCRNRQNTTDLYAAAAGSLYRFSSAPPHQKDGAVAAVVRTDDLFRGVRKLFASAAADGAVTVWGLNNDGHVFYTTCPASGLDQPGSWSRPLAISNGVEQLAPFVNRANSANTFFAHSGVGGFQVAVKSPKLTTWSTRPITLPPPKDKRGAQRSSAYVTRVHVTGPDGRPAAGRTVAITSPRNVTSVFINGLYHAVGPTEVRVQTDPTGAVTIVEDVSRLDGTEFVVAVVDDGGSRKSINPVEESSSVKGRLKALGSEEGLKAARVASPDGRTSRQLVKPGTDVRAAAGNIKGLLAAYDHVTTKPAGPAARATPTALRPTALAAFLGNATPIRVDAGDLFCLLESPTGHARAAAPGAAAGESWWEVFVDWVEDAISAAWHFVVKIGEAIYHFVLETFELVLAAWKYVIYWVVERVEDFLEFCGVELPWREIERTKGVLKNVFVLYARDEIGHVRELRTGFDAAMDEVVRQIDSWAGKPDAQFGDLLPASPAVGERPAPPSVAGSYLAYYLGENAHESDLDSDLEPPDGSASLLLKLDALLKDEYKTFTDAYNQLSTLVTTAGETNHLDVLKEALRILSGVVIKTFKALVDLLLDIFEAMATAALKTVTDPLYIPVVSEILSDFGVTDISPLDVVSWVAAFPVTVGYNYTQGSEPFPDNDLTTYLSTGAKDFASAVLALQCGKRPPAAADGLRATGDGSPLTLQGSISPEAHKASGVFHLLSGFLATSAGVMGLIETVQFARNGALPNGLVITNSVFGLMDSGARAIALTVAPRVPYTFSDDNRDTQALRWINFLYKFCFGAGKIYNYGWGDKAEALSKPLPAIEAVGDGVLVCAQFVYTCYHLSKIRLRPTYGLDEDLAIVDEVSNFALYVARISRDLLVAMPANEYVAAAFTLSRLVQAGLQFGEGGHELKYANTPY
ncbi:MAG TPA: hypothetical protein VD866_17755 [Urbifossiella sp.]|nr:hypothetical protein [Urbifossiella sp.]